MRLPGLKLKNCLINASQEIISFSDYLIKSEGLDEKSVLTKSWKFADDRLKYQSNYERVQIGLDIWMEQYEDKFRESSVPWKSSEAA